MLKRALKLLLTPPPFYHRHKPLHPAPWDAKIRQIWTEVVSTSVSLVEDLSPRQNCKTKQLNLSLKKHRRNFFNLNKINIYKKMFLGQHSCNVVGLRMSRVGWPKCR